MNVVIIITWNDRVELDERWIHGKRIHLPRRSEACRPKSRPEHTQIQSLSMLISITSTQSPKI